MKRDKKYTIYMVYAPDAPKKFLRNPFFTLNKKAALFQRKKMREQGYHPELSIFFSPPCTFFTPLNDKNKGFARLDALAA